MENWPAQNRPRLNMATSCRLRSLTGASSRQRQRPPTNIGTKSTLKAAGSRSRVEISIVAGISARMVPGSDDVPNLHVLTATIIGSRRRCCRQLLGRWEEQRPGMRMSRGNKRCWRTIVIGITARATVRASPGRDSGQGKKERDTQLGRSGSETWCGVALAVMEYRAKVAVMLSEEQRRGRRLNDEHRCRPTTVGGITARAILRAG